MSPGESVSRSAGARMVDVGDKPDSRRIAVARARVVIGSEAFQLLRSKSLFKGDVLAVAQVAGISAAKRTAELIPLCHPLPLTHVSVDLEPREEGDAGTVEVTASAETVGKTGVEMEALTAVTVAALTVYDMVKSHDRAVRITDVRLVEKRGGLSGDLVLE